MPDERKQVPAVFTALSKATRESGAPLDPEVRARIRREAGDTVQHSWDVSVNPGAMLKALMVAEPDPAVLLPPAKFIERATQRFEAHGHTVDPTVWRQTMRTSAKMLMRADFAGAITWLRHAYTGAGLALTPEAAYHEMADLVRGFFPCAPEHWRGSLVNECRAILGRLPDQGSMRGVGSTREGLPE